MNLITGAGLPLTRVQRALAHTKMKKKERIVKRREKEKTTTLSEKKEETS